MSLASRLLTLALVFLLLCAFTTSLLKTEPPTFARALKKFSEVSVDVEGLFTKFTIETVIDPIIIPDDADGVLRVLYEFMAFFVNAINEIVFATTLIASTVILLYEVGNALLTICKAVIYLMFGIDLDEITEGKPTPATA